MAATDDLGPSAALKALEQAISAASSITLPVEEEHYFYDSFPAFKTETTGFLTRIQALLTTLPGAAPAPDSTFHNVLDAQDWTTTLLDDTLGKVDDAVADAKRAMDTKTTQPEPVETAAAATKLETAAAVVVASAASRAPQQQQQQQQHQPSYVSYMQSTLKEKPQTLFADGVHNDNVPFIPNLSHLSSIIDVEAVTAATAAAVANNTPKPHPLQAQLDALHYPEWQLAVPETPHQYLTFDETPFQFIDTVQALEAAAARLAQVTELAVDLEAHSYRSFQGFCCLMQLSTRTEDFIVDVIALRPHIGRCLAPIFANPGIVKVLHGSDGDMVWLQRDFGIYTCNLFDTGQAARVLNYPGHGLAYLLDTLCQFKADKRWQLADWRLRPLSAEALHYARADTHYLLHCYDRVRQQLAAMTAVVDVSPHLVVNIPAGNPGGALGTVLERSRRICLQQYEKELLKEDSFLTLYERLNKNFTEEQLSMFAALFAWRDKVAREEDESLGYVLSRAQLISLTEALPITVAELSRVLGKGAALVQRRAKEVLGVMAAARANTGPVAEIRRQWREAGGGETFGVRGGRSRGGATTNSNVIELLPDMAAAAAAAAASSFSPPPSSFTTTLKPRAVNPLASGGGGQVVVVVDNPPPTSSSLTTTLKPRALAAPLNSSKNSNPSQTAAATASVPKLAVSSASSLFGSLLAGGGPGDGDGFMLANVMMPRGFDSFVTTTTDNAAAVEEEIEEGEIDESGSAEEKKAAVRAAMTQLASEHDAEEKDEEDGDDDVVEEKNKLSDVEDFMPLSLSDKYGLKQKRKRRQEEGGGFNGGVKKFNGGGGGGGGGKIQIIRGEGGDSQAVKQRFKDLGLEGDADGDGQQQNDDDDDEDGVVVVDYAAAASKYDFQMVNPHARPYVTERGERGRGGRGDRGRGRGGRGGGERGRGGGGGGRGKRGAEEHAPVPEGRFNPYAGLDMSGIKGGKRSAVHVRSGNKSGGWK